MPLEIIILASGRGVRMRSAWPKSLQHLAGKPLLAHLLESARVAGARRIHIVHGADGDVLQRQCAGDAKPTLNWVLQDPPCGTAHAVSQALPDVARDSMVCVLYADTPLVTPATIRRLAAIAAGASNYDDNQNNIAHRNDRGTGNVNDDTNVNDDKKNNPAGKNKNNSTLAIVTTVPDDPARFGRIVRDDDGRVTAIREYADASDEERAVREVHSGILATPAAQLKAYLPRIGNDNAAREYYLTDIVALAVADGIAVQALRCDDALEVTGVNSRAELATLERCYQTRLAMQLMAQGVCVRDPARLDIRGTLKAGRDCVLDINVVIEGRVTLGERVTLGPGVVVRDSNIASDVTVQAYSVLDGARIAAHCLIGPFARIRPHTTLGQGARVGNFVELKEADIGEESKVSHLSYIGDATVGREVNIGAGAITCNYDGVRKNQTEVGDGAFIGSNAQLVAPVKIGKDATVGAGSTISRDAPPGSLAVTRAPQRNLSGWSKRAKLKKQSKRTCNST